MHTSDFFDVLVIGGGPGGYKAAQLIAGHGFRTAVAEKEALGGVCLNHGCIPFKTYLHTAHILHDAASLRAQSLLSGEALSLSFPALYRQKEEIISALRQGVQMTLDACGVTVLRGEAHVIDASADCMTVEVRGERYACKKLVLATGSRPAFVPQAPQGAAYSVADSRAMLSLESLPETVDVLGGGAIGLEAACFLAEAGCGVTVLEAAQHIGGRIDREISGALSRILRKKGVRILTGAHFERADREAVLYRQGETVFARTPQLLLCAAGRLPQFDAGELDLLGVRYTYAGIIIDAQCRTQNPNVFACGDATGKSMLAHTAYRQAKVIADVLGGRPAHMDYTCIPCVLYTSPEVLCIGLTEHDCEEQGIDYRAHALPMTYSGKYFAENGRDGAVAKMIVDAQKRVIGLQLIGNGAAELSLAAELMIRERMPASEIEDLVFAHPSYSEIFGDLASSFNC